MSFAIDIAEQLIKKHEGLSLKPYHDTVDKLTIGYGRNLEDVGISKTEAEMLLIGDIIAVNNSLLKLAWYKKLDGVRQAALMDMVFNIGFARFLGFKKFIAHLEKQNYVMASEEMLRSKWAMQVGKRAIYLSSLILRGEYTQETH